jgi:hypothetical protein
MSTAVHPLTEKRLKVEAEFRKRLNALEAACIALGKKEVDAEYVQRKRDEAQQSLAFLVEAAVQEGMGDD